MDWIRKNWKLAGGIAVALVIVLSGALDGLSVRKTAAGYLDLARGWAAAYQRDTAATKTAYEARIKTLTAERDAARKRYESARARMDAEWTPPKDTKELEARFRALGYAGRVIR